MPPGRYTGGTLDMYSGTGLQLWMKIKQKKKKNDEEMCKRFKTKPSWIPTKCYTVVCSKIKKCECAAS